MLPVSKWTRTRSLLKLSTKAFISAGRHQVAVEEDVLDVEVDASASRPAGAACRPPRCARWSHTSFGHRLVVGPPGDVDRAGHDQQVLGAQVVRRPRPSCRPAPARGRAWPGRCSVSGYGQNRNEHSPLIAMPISLGRLADRRELLRPGLRREVAVEVVVQLDAVEPGVLGELQALFEGHLLAGTGTPTG